MTDGRDDGRRVRAIAELVATTRRDRGWSQSELAKRCGIPRHVVNALETQFRMPAGMDLDAMAGALGIVLPPASPGEP